MNIKRLTQMLTFYDKMLIIFILVIAIAWYWILVLNTEKTQDDTVVIRQNGKVVLKLTQSEFMKDTVYDFRFDGETGSIEIKDGKVRMLPMDKRICPKSICSKMGWIDGSPETIICIPNQLIVSFISNKSSKIDVIVS